MYLKSRLTSGLCAAVLAVPILALAADPGQARGTEAATAPHAATAAPAGAAPATVATGTPAAAAPRPAKVFRASPAELEGMRGGAGMSSSATLAGTLDGNSAAQVVTGNNVIQSGSFANASGLPVVIQNSGANVLIQNATVINLELK